MITPIEASIEVMQGWRIISKSLKAIDRHKWKIVGGRQNYPNAYLPNPFPKG